MNKGHIALGKEICHAFKTKIISVLEQHQSKFVWEGKTPTQVARHMHCNTQIKRNPSLPARHQKHRDLTVDRQEAAKEEIKIYECQTYSRSKTFVHTDFCFQELMMAFYCTKMLMW